MAEPRGKPDGSVIEVGTMLTDAMGGVRAVATRPLHPTDTHLYYRLIPGGKGDWEGDSWVYTAAEQAAIFEPTHFFKVQRKTQPGGDVIRASSAHAVAGDLIVHSEETQPRNELGCGGGGGGVDDDASSHGRGQSWSLGLVEQIRARCWATLGATPHVVICQLAPSLVECSLSFDDAMSTVVGPELLRQRAEQCWENYHSLIEVARWQAIHGQKQKHHLVERGGTALFIEVHPLQAGAAWRMGGNGGPEGTGTSPAGNISSAGTEAVQLGYGLPKYELTSALRQPSGKLAPPDARTVTRAFQLFDRDGSGTIDSDELRGVCKEIGMAMSEEDSKACMSELDEDGSGDIDLKEFRNWFLQLAAPGSGSNGQASKLEQLKIRSVLARSSVAALARRLQTANPAEAVTGEMALGSLLCAVRASRQAGSASG